MLPTAFPQTIEQVYSTRYKADCKELELRCVPSRCLFELPPAVPQSASCSLQGGMAVALWVRRGSMRSPSEQRFRVRAVVVCSAMGESSLPALTVPRPRKPSLPAPARLGSHVLDATDRLLLVISACVSPLPPICTKRLSFLRF